ncbi:nickel-dependent hydrogenase large subunit [Methylocystis echinoides]|uniref:Uptake hydrogenase large subunit n=1 Tax=Methylocystis echinoides TaxID=29468 RepID=A0A9W6LSF4_9HYPH|nr:nickel-dependent hydrogenase large subunit [Methylocystis echinoides]GLI93442.1 hydrogenase 2 large subunit [Methylocystis echinoides]
MTDPNVIIDPVTRIEGHLRIQAYATPAGDGGTIGADVLVASTMVRGVEKILQGRDPRDAWAFTQRICGVCTVVHGLTSVRAVEAAANIKVPKNADYIRNMMIGAQYVHDHVMHFYHLHALDWVDVVSALTASSSETAALAVKNNPTYKPNNGALPTAAYFDSIKNALNSGLVSRGQLGFFSNGYWGHPAYKLSPAENLLLLSHYLEALTWAREVVKLHAIFGGKDPHPNVVVGGMPCSISTNTGSISERAGGTSLNTAGLTIAKNAVLKMQQFVDQVYAPDVRLLALRYSDWAKIGKTTGNFLSFGEFPDPTRVKTELTDGAIDYPDGYILPQNVITSPNLKTLVGFDQSKVTENITHSWYSGSDGVHPSAATTDFNYTGPAPDPEISGKPYMLDPAVKYSWIKSPRYNGKAMEVGPLAHILIMYARSLTTKALPTDKLVKYYVDRWWSGSTASGGLGLAYEDLNSTMGRIFCRMLETKIIADQMAGRPAVSAAGVTSFTGWYNQYYANRTGKYFNPTAFAKLASYATLPDKVGFGFTEAPRGALGHWVKISRSTGMIENYQCIVASQWNAGPRDGASPPNPGPYETALMGHKLARLNQPLEVLRTIHSFDPCIGCAVHILDPEGKPLVEVDINHATRC